MKTLKKKFYENAVNNYELLIELYAKENEEMAAPMRKLHEASKKSHYGKFDTLVTAELRKRGFQIDNIDELKNVTQGLTGLQGVQEYVAENLDDKYDSLEVVKLSLLGILNYLDITITQELENEVDVAVYTISGLV